MKITVIIALGVAGIAAAAAGCSTGAKEETPPASSKPASSKPAVVSPTEKGVFSTPPRAFNQGMNAADGKSALESEGYNVQITWGLGRQDQPLSTCTISSVDGLRGNNPPDNTTVYLTVNCP